MNTVGAETTAMAQMHQIFVKHLNCLTEDSSGCWMSIEELLPENEGCQGIQIT